MMSLPVFQKASSVLRDIYGNRSYSLCEESNVNADLHMWLLDAWTLLPWEGLRGWGRREEHCITRKTQKQSRAHRAVNVCWESQLCGVLGFLTEPSDQKSRLCVFVWPSPLRAWNTSKKVMATESSNEMDWVKRCHVPQPIWGCLNKTPPGWVAYAQGTLISHGSGGWKSKIKQIQCLGRTRFLAERLRDVFSLGPHWAEGMRELSEVAFTKALNPTPRDPITSQRPHLQMPPYEWGDWVATHAF